MCEYCGCQQVTLIDELTQEHDALVAMMAGVRAQLASGDLAGVAAACRRMTQILGPHTLVEEEGLFPQLSEDYPEQTLALQAQHRSIEGVLAQADAGVPADPAWPQQVRDVLFLLREHILKEQDGVFPAALATLDPDQWDRVQVVRARAGSPTHQGDA